MASRKGPDLSLTVLVYPDEDNPRLYIAHCLELDVVAAGETKPKAIVLLKELIGDLIVAAEQDGTLDKVLRPAPRKYWQMLARSRPYKPTKSVTMRRIDARPVKRVDYALAGTR